MENKKNALLCFIDYLYDNIHYFSAYDDAVEKYIEQLTIKNSDSSFGLNDIMQYSSFLIESLQKLLQLHVVNLIEKQAIELNLYDPTTPATTYGRLINHVNSLIDNNQLGDYNALLHDYNKKYNIFLNIKTQLIMPLLFMNITIVLQKLNDHYTPKSMEEKIMILTSKKYSGFTNME